MGIRRNEVSLKQALQQVLSLKQQLASTHIEDSVTDTKLVKNTTLNKFRFQRLLTLASLLLQSALVRTESRGGHYREDYPSLTDMPSMSVVFALASQSAGVNNSNAETAFIPHSDTDMDLSSRVAKAS